jgi:thiol-disulfide isomerase/thioredoxin
MKRVVTAISALRVIAICTFLLPQAILAADAAAKAGSSVKAGSAVKADPPASTPADRIVVMYFHRTQRCPTCLKMGSYSEEAVKTGFAQQMKKGKVEFHYIDFQDKKNAALTKGYNVSGPTLIVVKVVNNKVADRKDLAEIWTKVRDKVAFVEYVQGSVTNYQN